MISVIMLTYNRIDYASNMIQDILNQTYSDFEFVIVDNGSDDGTAQVLQEWANKDSRIKIRTIEKSTIGHGRNAGVQASKGEYIAFVDDDDRVKTDFLEFLMNLIKENNADISMCGASQGDGTTWEPQCLFDEKYVLNGEEATRLLLGRKYIRNGTATKLYRRGLLEEFPFVEHYKNEDLHTQYKYFLASKVVVIHGVDKYYITRHTSNVSGFTSNASAWDRQTISDYWDAYRNRTLYIKDHAPSLYDYAKYCEWSFMISMVDKITTYKLDGCTDLREKLVGELKEHLTEFLATEELQPFERKWIHDYIENPA